MQRTRISDIFASDAPFGETLVQGWVKTRRSSKSVTFVQVNDGSTLRDLQVVVGEDSPHYSLANSLTTGCSVSIVGSVVESQGKGQRYEVQAQEVRLMGEADPETYPLQKKRHTPEFLREIAHLRPRTNTFGAMARVRNAAAFAIHSFFPGTGVPVHPDADHHRQRRRRRGLDVPRHYSRPRQPAATRGSGGHSGGLLRTPHLPYRQRTVEAEIFAMALSNVYTFGRRSGRRTPTPHGTWPSSGWWSRRWLSASWRAWRNWPRIS